MLSRFCCHANSGRAKRFGGFLRTFPRRTGTVSVGAPAGAGAGPHGHMMSPTDQPGEACKEGEVSVYLHKHLYHHPRAQCLLPPSVCVCMYACVCVFLRAVRSFGGRSQWLMSVETSV